MFVDVLYLVKHLEKDEELSVSPERLVGDPVLGQSKLFYTSISLNSDSKKIIPGGLNTK